MSASNASDIESIIFSCISHTDFNDIIHTNDTINLNILLVSTINQSKYNNDLKNKMLLNRNKYENLLVKYMLLKEKFLDECINVRCFRISNLWDTLDNLKMNTDVIVDPDTDYYEDYCFDEGNYENINDGIIDMPQECTFNENIKDLIYKKLELEQELIIKYKKLKKMYKEQIVFDSEEDDNEYDSEDLNIFTFSECDENEYNERDDFEELISYENFQILTTDEKNILKNKNSNFYEAMKMIYTKSHPHLIDIEDLIFYKKYKELCIENINLRENLLHT